MDPTEEQPTKFGKGLFIGMAYVAGAGSIVTLLGAARGADALGFYMDITGMDVGFFQLTCNIFPIGWIMTFLLWGFFMILCKPEKKVIHGLKKKATRMYKELGAWSTQEILAAVIVIGTILIVSGKSFIPAMTNLHKTGILLCSTILFFLVKILDLDDLEEVPWNIILLFAGAMSIGFCSRRQLAGPIDQLTGEKPMFNIFRLEECMQDERYNTLKSCGNLQRLHCRCRVI